MTNIEACPFCGEENDIDAFYVRNEDGFIVQCISCGSHGPVCETEDKAVLAWNNANERY